MNEQTLELILRLATLAAEAGAKAIADFHAQQGMNEDQLLEFAEQKDADTRDRIQAYVAKLKAEKAV
jgi:delta-aminolevulinic acid dehydratase/porphobilinogen synthase